MDAKKAAKHFEPHTLLNGKGFGTVLSWVGYAGIGVIFMALGFHWLVSEVANKKIYYRDNRFDQYLRSDEAKVARARFRGFVPPPKDTLEKHFYGDTSKSFYQK